MKGVHGRFGVSVVMVTHDLYKAYTMVAYSGGRVIQAASPCELFS